MVEARIARQNVTTKNLATGQNLGLDFRLTITRSKLPVAGWGRRYQGALWRTLVRLLREVPEEMKPRRIAVATTDGTPEAEQVEAPKQVA